MHSYLRAVGFSKLRSRNQLEKVYRATLRTPNRKIITTINFDTSLIQFEKDFSDSIGLTLIGEYDLNGSLSIEHYFPYIKGDIFSNMESITVEKQTDKESYAGVCEDYRLGMTLIFYIQNIADYAKSKWLNYSNRTINKVKLSGLSISGSILLGTEKKEEDVKKYSEYKKAYEHMLRDVKEGTDNAVERLALYEMDTFSRINARMRNEDMFSIIDTSCMPCGVECDHYMIIGNILSYKFLNNKFTNEKICTMIIEVNDFLLTVCINSIDLQGEPKIGRRFRGEIWLQGYIQI